MKPEEQVLFDAIARGDLAAVRTALVEADACASDDGGVPALVAAARLGQVEIVGALLEAGAEIQARVCRPEEVVRADEAAAELDGVYEDRVYASRNEDALGAAIRLDHEGVIERLVEGGVRLRPELRNDHECPLSDAAAWGSAAVVRVLMDAGAPINYGAPCPLEAAASAGRAEIVQMLLDAGAAVDAKDEDGGTALLCAASSGDVATVQVFLGAGADIGEWCQGDNVLRSAVHAGLAAPQVATRGW